jgi:CubicO group peptidase (beta-lactamase class C family)
MRCTSLLITLLAALTLTLTQTAAAREPVATAWTVSQQAPRTVAQPEPTAPRSLDELLAHLRHILDSSGTPGASLALVRGDTVLYAGALGLARVSPPQPATAATLFRVGSTAKILIGLTAIALEHEGRLSLQQPLSVALPSYRIRNAWEATDTLRLVHLLEHTSGIDDNSIKAYANSGPVPISLADGLAIDAARQVTRWPPGARFSYSNTGPAVVARLIELVEGRSFEAIVQTRWFDRLGMRSATYFEPRDPAQPLASLYLPGREVPIPYWHVFARPIGALNATASDMAALLRLLVGRGVIGTDTLLQPGALDRAERSQTWIGTRVGLTEAGYGLGLYTTEGTDGRLWAGHAGGVEGGLSDLSYLPADGVGYSLQINASRGRALRLMSELVRAFLTRDLAIPVPPAVAPLSPVIGRDFVGWYRPVTPRPQIVAAFERVLGLTRVRVVRDAVHVVPLIGDSARYVPTDSLAFRTERGAVSTLAFHRRGGDALAAPAMEGFNSGGSYVRLAGWDVLATFTSTGAWLLSLVLAPIVACGLGVRLLVHRVSRRNHAMSSPVTLYDGAWWCAAGAAVMVAMFCWSAMQGFQDVRQFGTVSRLSVPVAVAPLVYATLTVCGGWFVRRRVGPPATLASRVSLWAARGVLMTHAIATVYALRYGLMGYRPWG